MNAKKVLLLGGSGFIGSAVAEALTKRGHVVTIPTRHRDHAKHLLLLPTCDVVEANVWQEEQLTSLICMNDVVINLVGILHGDFEAVHVTFPHMVAEASVKAGVHRLIHMSALNADANGPSQYLRSRGRGEVAVRDVADKQGLAVTMFRPSVVFGEHDRFLNLFADLLKMFPILPLGTPDAAFQPVWVEDVAHAISQAVDMPETIGKNYPLVGPSVYSLRQLISFVIDVTQANCMVIGLGNTLSQLQATIFGMLPGKLITRDNVASMSLPSTSSEPFPAIFGSASAMEVIVRRYMQNPVGRGRYQRLRNAAGR